MSASWTVEEAQENLKQVHSHVNETCTALARQVVQAEQDVIDAFRRREEDRRKKP
jgi:hypothetical protein